MTKERANAIHAKACIINQAYDTITAKGYHAFYSMDARRAYVIFRATRQGGEYVTTVPESDFPEFAATVAPAHN